MTYETLAASLLAMTFAPSVALSETAAEQEGRALGEVYFAFDSARVPSSGADAIARAARWAKEHPDAQLVVDGHADPRGSSAYNVALGLRRSDGVRDKLVAHGVPADRILIVTYGEDGIDRTQYALERRATIWATQEPLHAIVDKALVRGTAVIWDEPVTAAEIDGVRPTETIATR